MRLSSEHPQMSSDELNYWIENILKFTNIKDLKALRDKLITEIGRYDKTNG